QGRNLAEAEEMAKDLTAVWMDVQLDDIDVTLTVAMPDEATLTYREAEELFDQAAQAKSRAAIKSRETVQILRSQDWTLRDIGTALGISYQRVHQLLDVA
ncbi:MAG: hypothetical protein FWG47_08215, partial [Propionibacteriaceae bacterium]|nr:hypothetical protein [Propionibacteriaceae bacterium]